MSDSVLTKTEYEEFLASDFFNQYGIYQPTDRISFKPVKGTEDAIKSRAPVNGYVYFATDTKKIYLGTKTDFLPMGGNSGIYYANRAILEDESELDSIIFTMDDIDGEMIPNVNDLILNEEDAFYRVETIFNNSGYIQIIGKKMIVAGSNSSNGPASTKPIIQEIGSLSYYFAATDAIMPIQFMGNSAMPDNNGIETVTIKIGTQTFYDETGYQFGEPIIIDLVQYKSLLSTSQTNSINISITDYWGATSNTKTFRVDLIELSLDSDYAQISKINKGQELPYVFNPSYSAALQDAYVEVIIALKSDLNQIAVTQIYDNFEQNVSNTEYIDLSNCEHNAYVLKAVLRGKIPNGKWLESNTVTHTIVYYDDEKTTPIVTGQLSSTTLYEYDTLEVQYIIADNSSITSEVIAYMITNSESVQIKTEVNKISEWKKLFNKQGNYDIQIEYNELKYPIGEVVVYPYEGEIPVINTDDSGLSVYLTSQGRSNDEVNKESWTWKNVSTTFSNFLWGETNGWIADETGAVALRLTNGAQLVLNNYLPFATDATSAGMTIELDFSVSGVLDYSKPLIQCLSTFGTDKQIQCGFNITGQKATLNSSHFKATTTAIDGSGEEGENEQDGALQAFTQFFNENERIHLTYVIQRIGSQANKTYYVFTYLNGVLSGIKNLKNEGTVKESFVDAVNGTPAVFTVDSTYGDINLYNIRFYRRESSHQQVINNYIADLTDMNQKVQLYKDNKIYDNSGKISLKAIQNIGYNLGVPYVLFNGGNEIKKKLSDAFTYDSALTTNDFALPLTKSDYRLMSVKMFDTMDPTKNLDISMELENVYTGEKISKFKDIAPNVNYKVSNGVQVYGQGTSSMVYPVKNLRLKFAREEDFPTVYSGSCPVEIVCFKADFMDSSSSHNTGTANLIYDLYTNLNLRTPPQQFMFDNSKEMDNPYDVSTAIRGYPIICFYAPGDSTEYTYIGKYNFNLDKATPEPFGFPPFLIYTGKNTIDSNGITRNEVKTCGYKVETVNGLTVLPVDENGSEIKIDLTQCWEFLNNDNVSPTKFMTLAGYSSFKDCLKALNNKNLPLWLDYYEDRYPDEIVGDTEDGKDTSEATKNFFDMCDWVNSTGTDQATNSSLPKIKYYPTLHTEWHSDVNYYTADGVLYPITTSEGSSIENTSYKEVKGVILSQELDFTIFKNKIGAGNFDSYPFTYSSDENAWIHDGNIVNLADYGISVVIAANATLTTGNSLTVNYFQSNNWNRNLYEKFEKDTIDYRLAKFNAEFENYFNLDFCLFYYCITMILLMMDSRAKNMMIASWDQKTWYPIFYDMDTALGVNNTGYNKYSFNAEDDPLSQVFNGYDSVLWNNLRETRYNQICEFYARLRNEGGLTLEKLLKTYNEGQGDKWNAALFTADAVYKYTRPYEEGYYDGSSGEPSFIAPKLRNYLYAGQGRRSNHRSWWLSNRLGYLDSKYLPITYGSNKPGADTFQFRAYEMPEQKNTVNTQACIAQTPANHAFEITALNDSYQSLFMGTTVYGPIYTKAGETVTVGPASPKTEVESWILNPSLISDLGDLSNKYLGQLFFPSEATRLTALRFGRSSRSHPDAYDKYYNKLLSALDISDKCPYLTYLNIARLTGLIDLNLSQCLRLTELDAEGCTKLSSITLPSNSVLEKLYLPANLTELILNTQPYLEVLNLEGINSLKYLDFIDIPYNTYNLIYDTLNLNLETYYFKNVIWEVSDTVGLTIENNNLTGIKILDMLIEGKAKPASGRLLAQALSGILTIKTPGIIIDEYAIYAKYHPYFPSLRIEYGPEADGLIEAPHICFMNREYGSPDAAVYYEVFSNGNQTLGFLTGESSPAGKLNNPSSYHTVEYRYIFNNRWQDSNGYLYVYKDSDISDLSTDLTYYIFEDQVPQADMTFYPVFKSEKREYAVKLYDSDNKIIYSESVAYGNTFSYPNFNYKDSSDLDDNMRWAFKGWTTVNYNNNPSVSPTFVDTTSLVITGDITLYAYYLEEDCTQIASSYDYFTISGSTINIKNEYRNTLQGKITLPSVDANGTPLTTIGNFMNAPLITHVFFLRDASYTTINNNAFESNVADKCILQAIYLPETITHIGSSAFAKQTNLKIISNTGSLPDKITYIGSSAFDSGSTNILMQVHINELPSNLKTLGAQAFYSGGPNIVITELPAGLTVIDTWTFARCSNVNITTFGSDSGEVDGSQLTTIKNGAFYLAGSTVPYVEIKYSVNEIDNYNDSDYPPFRDYSPSTIANVRHTRALSEYGVESVTEWGFITSQSEGG